MNRLRSHLTYANVISTIALFLALTGGAVYAAGKIHSGDIAKNAIKSKQIAPKAVKPSDMATPVQFVASAKGGEASFPSSAENYPLSGKTSWTQSPKQVDQFFVQATGTVTPSSGGGFPSICFASVTIKAGDQPVASILFTGSGSQTQSGNGVLLDTGSKVKRTLTASIQGSNCDPTSHVDSVTVRAIGTG
jgi:hypothetical protein